MYGWLGNDDLGRENNGELLTTMRPPLVHYITAKSLLDNLEQIMMVDNNLTFNATLVTPIEPSMCTVCAECGNNIQFVLKAALGVLSSIILVQIAVLICVCQGFHGQKCKQERSKM